MDLTLFADLSRVLKDIVLAVAACIGAYVAFSGLSTWKLQLKGKAEYEIARALLKNALQARDRLQAVRNPFFPPGQTQEESFESMRRAFEERFRHFDNAAEQLEVSILEAEALWGDEARAIFEEFRKVSVELAGRVREYLWVENPRHPGWVTVDRNPERLERLRETALALCKADEDKYWLRLKSSIESVRDFVLPHLR
jgi:hypothetical protein